MEHLFWLWVWSLTMLTEASVLRNCSAAKEDPLLPTVNKTLFGRDQHLKGDDFHMIELKGTLLPTIFLNISHHILSEHKHIVGFIECLLRDYMLAHFIVSIFTLGLFGNIVIFFFLLFHFKKNSWTAYIWNLAVANFGVLMFLCSICVFAFVNYICNDSSDAFVKLFLPLSYLFLFMVCSNLHFLVGTSMDWCLAALFPRWHRCHQPNYLSPLISVLLSVLLWPLSCQLLLFFSFSIDIQKVTLIALIVVVPFMVISMQTLVVNVWCSLHQQRKLHTEVLLGTLFSLVTWAPIRLFFALNNDFAVISLLAFVFTSLSSTINPVLYILIGQIVLPIPESRKPYPRWFPGRYTH